MERRETRDSENWTLNIFQEESKYSFISSTSKLFPWRQISHIILWVWLAPVIFSAKEEISSEAREAFLFPSHTSRAL